MGVSLLAGCAFGPTACLYVLHPELQWYAGLSGALHGLWAGCALYGICLHPHSAAAKWSLRPATMRIWHCVALLLLATKLAAEMYFGPSAFSVRAIGAPVVTAAHLYGALSGLAVTLMVLTGARVARFRLK
jgi:hypothetical protein